MCHACASAVPLSGGKILGLPNSYHYPSATISRPAADLCPLLLRVIRSLPSSENRRTHPRSPAKRPLLRVPVRKCRIGIISRLWYTRLKEPEHTNGKQKEYDKENPPFFLHVPLLSLLRIARKQVLALRLLLLTQLDTILLVFLMIWIEVIHFLFTSIKFLLQPFWWLPTPRPRVASF